jgi:soluble lytic murein transglycosylase-like protein
MQLMPDTARLHNVLNAFDPVDNIEGGVRHLRMLLERYQGDLRLSLAAYNAGSGAVEKHGGIPPFAETREYVRRVLRFYEAFRGGRS